MTAREPSAVEVIAEALDLSVWVGFRDDAGDDDSAEGTIESDDRKRLAKNALAALEAAGFVVATRERLADAWDEGYGAGQEDEAFWSRGLSTDSDADEHPHANPHREVQP